MARGISVAKPGGDALTDEIKDLLYTTRAASLKLFDTGLVTFTAESTGPTTTVNFGSRNLGYVPVCRVFVETVPGTNRWFVDTNNQDSIDVLNTPVAAIFMVDVTESQLRVRFSGLTVGLKYRFRYYIFEDRIA